MGEKPPIRCEGDRHRYDPPITFTRTGTTSPMSCVCGALTVRGSLDPNGDITITGTMSGG